MSDKSTSMGIEEHVANALCYALGWLSGLIILLIEKENDIVRYHAAQSIIIFGSITLLNIILPMFLFLGGLAIMSLVNLAAFVLWIVFIVTALNKKPLKIDFLASYAEQLSGKVKP